MSTTNNETTNQQESYYIPVTPPPGGTFLTMGASSGSNSGSGNNSSGTGSSGTSSNSGGSSGSGSGGGGNSGSGSGSGNGGDCIQNGGCVKSGNMLVKEDWYHPHDHFGKNKPIEWDTSNDQFEIRVQTNFNTNPPTPPHPRIATDKNNGIRHYYDILTKCECYTDFHLEVQFRCPDMREVWSHQKAGGSHEKGINGPPCGAPLFGTANWGNSGIYLLNTYEIQIHDSYMETPQFPLGASTKLNDYGCELLSKTLCGAVYNQAAPFFDLNNLEDVTRVFNIKFKESQNSPGEQFVPSGEWNRMDIYFMAPRYEIGNQGELIKRKFATVAVILNKIIVGGVAKDRVVWRFPIQERTSGSRKLERHYGLTPDTLYGNNYYVMHGPIGIQEHDNKVQYKTFKINPDWKPVFEGTDEFDLGWQINNALL